MFTEKDINTLIGLFYAASKVPSSDNPQVYRENFTDALTQYFKCYPDDDVGADSFAFGDLSAEE